MTFPLGSLRSESSAPPSGTAGAASSGGTYRRDSGKSTPAPAAVPHHASWRMQLGLLVTGVLWLLAVLALATHNAADSAFSTSGSAAGPLNKAGTFGAWFSDLALFAFGYSMWWAVLVSARA